MKITHVKTFAWANRSLTRFGTDGEAIAVREGKLTVFRPENKPSEKECLQYAVTSVYASYPFFLTFGKGSNAQYYERKGIWERYVTVFSPLVPCDLETLTELLCKEAAINPRWRNCNLWLVFPPSLEMHKIKLKAQKPLTVVLEDSP